MPYTLVEPKDIRRLELDPSSQMLIVNCPGNLPKAANGRIRDFVERGGSLLTTDRRVQVLVESRELASKRGESPVVVTFQFGKGEVLL